MRHVPVGRLGPAAACWVILLLAIEESSAEAQGPTGAQPPAVELASPTAVGQSAGQAGQELVGTPSLHVRSGGKEAPRNLEAVATLDGLLDRLQENALVYLRGVPNFFCSEHVVSERQLKHTAFGFQRQITDSTFRLRRVAKNAQVVDFEERRQLLLVDGNRPAVGKSQAGLGTDEGNLGSASTEIDSEGLGGPSIVYGVFSHGLKLVTTQGRQCFRYKLLPTQRGREKEPYVIRFWALPPKERAANCLNDGRTEGRVLVDRTLLRVVRIEKKTEKYRINPVTTATWSWAADYAPVKFGEETFWMPKTVTSTSVAVGWDPLSREETAGAAYIAGAKAATAAGLSPPGTTWCFTADYRKLAAKVTLLPCDENQKLPAAETPDEQLRP